MDGPLQDDEALDARFVQRSLTTLRDRVRMQEDEIDTLRAMVRSLQKNSVNEHVVHFQERLAAIEAGLQETQAAPAGETVEEAVQRVRNEVMTRFKLLEAADAEQGRAVHQVREMMSRTEANLQRLLIEVDRLVTEVASHPEPPAQSIEAAAPESLHHPEPTIPDLSGTAFDADVVYPRFRWRIPAIILGALALVFLVIWLVTSNRGSGEAGTADASSALSPIEQGRIYESQKNYTKAESIYRDMLKKDPNNGEVAKRLESVLFRQDKWEEAAAIMKKFAGTNSSNP